MSSVFVFHQTVSSTTWEIEHNLGGAPVVDVVIDLNGKREKAFPASIKYVDENNITIEFSVARTGTATLRGSYKNQELNPSWGDSST